MKAICPREGLLSACQLTGQAVAARDVKPILANIKAIAGENGCTLLATDLEELGIRLDVRSVKVEEAGEALLPAARLIAILRESTDDELTITADADKVTVQGQFTEFEMASTDPGEFPPVAEFTDEKFCEIQAGALREMIRRTVFAAAKENARWAQAGVLWEVGEKEVKLVATDSRRLAMASGTSVSSKAASGGDAKGPPHIVPPRAMSLLERLLQDAGESIRVSLTNNEAKFKTERATVISRLVEGRFPPYGELLGKKLPVKVTLEPARFQTAVRQASIMAGEESKGVAFKFGKKKLTLEAQGHDTGRAKVEMPIEYDAKDLTINFNPGYLVEMLRVLPADAPLVLEMADSNTPAIFKSGADYVYLVMPLTDR